MAMTVKINPQVTFRTERRSGRPLASLGGRYGWTQVGPEYPSKIKAEEGRKAIVRTGRVGRIVEYRDGEPINIYCRNPRRHCA